LSAPPPPPQKGSGTEGVNRQELLQSTSANSHIDSQGGLGMPSFLIL
jgi:hypothetical protein